MKNARTWHFESPNIPKIRYELFVIELIAAKTTVLAKI